ncbi:MAG TPA: GAP family protein [Acidimicrobiales bacterium]
MGQAIGESLPFAIGVAISPIPIIAVVLMLLSKRAGANSAAFALGWVVGIAGVTAVVLAVAGSIGTTSDGSQSSGTSTVKLVLGILVLFLGLRNWRKRPAPGETTALPRWLRAIENITPGKSVGLGVGLSAINPKNLIMSLGGGIAISQAPTSPGGHVGAAVIFVALAATTVVVPVVLYRIMGARAQPMLESLDAWLEQNSATVMSVLLLVIGVVLIGKGIGGF